MSPAYVSKRVGMLEEAANVWAVYPQRLAGSAKVRVCVDFLERHLACDNRASPTRPHADEPHRQA